MPARHRGTTRAIDFSRLSDVTTRYDVDYGRTSLNEAADPTWIVSRTVYDEIGRVIFAIDPTIALRSHSEARSPHFGLATGLRGDANPCRSLA